MKSTKEPQPMSNEPKTKTEEEPGDGLVTDPQEVQMRLMQMLLDMSKVDCEGYDLADGTPYIEPDPTKQ